MLSILIPIYNYNCVQLVKSLHAQANEAGIAYEIRCIDDASSLYKEENRQIDTLNHCSYTELHENIGRSKIRNLLASNAIYNNLLFLDCDVEVFSGEFIRNYLPYLNDFEIISGKRIYTELSPTDHRYYLHWFYGMYRETKSSNFMSNNFVIKKSLLEKVKFNENITQYGHEDTLFQIQLEEIGIDIHFIDNPVVHIGLDAADDFIEKNNEGIKNLLYLSEHNIIPDKYLYRFRLLKKYKAISRYKLNKVFALLFPIFKKACIHNLKSNNPRIFFFDMYKLMFISHKDTKSTKFS